MPQGAGGEVQIPAHMPDMGPRETHVGTWGGQGAWEQEALALVSGVIKKT